MALTFKKKDSDVEKLKAAEAAAAEAAAAEAAAAEAKKAKEAKPKTVGAKGKLSGKASATVETKKENTKTGEVYDEANSTETVEVGSGVQPAGQLPVVAYGLGFTLNLGDFNSAKAYVSLSLPVEPTEINDGYDFCKEWVDERCAALQKELEG